MKREPTGIFEKTSCAGEDVLAFVPYPLQELPGLNFDPDLRRLLEQSHLALGRLDALSTLLPDPSLFLYGYVRKEALVSSQIEGTQSSLSDLLLFEMQEAPGVLIDDVTEVSNYVAALEHGWRRLGEGFPLCNRLVREIHEVLLSRGRGADKSPGEFRRSQNWIGGTRPGNAHFVPPPPESMDRCLTSLERFLHEDGTGYGPVLRAALVHVQFETVHPFLDGNGRVGRLLIPLMLYAAGVLAQPLLYLSLYFKQHRDRYYQLLDRVRLAGDWEAWLAFFLKGILETAEGAVSTARRLMTLFEEDASSIQKRGKGTASILRLHESLRRKPVASLQVFGEMTGLSVPTVTRAMLTLAEMGVVRELTGRKRNRLFGYTRYLEILSEGTETLVD